jgi:hypothetical protein
MKHILILGMAAIAIAGVLPPLPAAAEAGIKQVQVQFPKGKSGTTIHGSVTGNGTVDYVLRAAAGQTMTVKLAGGSTVYHNVLPPGSTGEALFVGSSHGASSTTTLPTSGPYTIRVYQMGDAKSSGKRSNFTLDVAITGTAQAAAGASKGGDDPMVEAAGRAGEGKFNATGKIPCAQAQGQPMGQCDFGVARAGGGTAAVSVTLPDGRKRLLMFSKGKAIGADLSQADGNMKFSASKQSDLYQIQAGNERYEVPEAVIFGG